MPIYATQSSFVISLSQKTVAYGKELFDVMRQIVWENDQELFTKNVSENPLEIAALQILDRSLDVGFKVADFKKNEDSEKDGLLVFEDECFNERTAAAFAQHLLREDDSDAIIEIHWSKTTNGTEPDCFGGGVVLVSAYQMDQMDTESWAMKARERMPRSFEKIKLETRLHEELKSAGETDDEPGLSL